LSVAEFRSQRCGSLNAMTGAFPAAAPTGNPPPMILPRAVRSVVTPNSPSAPSPARPECDRLVKDQHDAVAIAQPPHFAHEVAIRQDQAHPVLNRLDQDRRQLGGMGLNQGRAASDVVEGEDQRPVRRTD
jgi:hypothetical protein